MAWKRIVFVAAAAVLLSVPSAAVAPVESSSKADDLLAARLQRMEKGLVAIVSQPKSGHFVSALQPFVKELHAHLAKAEASSGTDRHQALLDAQTAAKELAGELSGRQEKLESKEATAKESLLVGILLARRAQPMEEQLEVLSNKDFKDLPVTAYLLRMHKKDQPLFQMAAAYLDQRDSKVTAKHGQTFLQVVRRSRAEGRVAMEMRRQTSGAVSLLEMNFASESASTSRDCPYCIEQCIEKCHNAGKPFMECTGTCADAGKGK